MGVDLAFRMREREDARSLAGLAMDVYSDHISIDQEEQERLRFSADDIIHLPIHTAINVLVARGTPRAAFVARTMPMQDLYDPPLAEHHLAAQRDRGRRHLTYLPGSLGDKPGRGEHPLANGSAARVGEPARARRGAGRGNAPPDAPVAAQLLLEDL